MMYAFLSPGFLSSPATPRANATQHPFKLAAGDERTGEDITIPLSNLHFIERRSSPRTTATADQWRASSLRDPDDQSKVESSKIERADGKFHLDLVPEGNYTLHIGNAADVRIKIFPSPRAQCLLTA